MPDEEWRPELEPVTADSLPQVLRHQHAVALFFWAVWDTHSQFVCRRVLEPLAEQYAGDMAFRSVEIDTELEICRFYKLRTTPTLLLIASGRIERVLEGRGGGTARTTQELIEHVNQFLKGAPDE